MSNLSDAKTITIGGKDVKSIYISGLLVWSKSTSEIVFSCKFSNSNLLLCELKDGGSYVNGSVVFSVLHGTTPNNLIVFNTFTVTSGSCSVDVSSSNRGYWRVFASYNGVSYDSGVVVRS